MQKVKERKSNFDLMRILAILLIIMFHYVSHGNYLYSDYNNKKLIFEATGIWGLLGVICFVMVSSHFLYLKGSFSLQKVVRLIFETSFYSFSITIILYILGLVNVGKLYILKCALSVFYKQYWFITDYLLFYMLTPFLKVLCDHINLESQKTLLIVLFLINFPLSNILYLSYLSRLGIFVYTYILISYFIKKPDNFFQKHYKLLSVIMFGFTMFLVCLFVYLNKITLNTKFLEHVTSISSITNSLIYLSSICVYFIFKNINIKYNKYLFFIGNSTLGIYLIHEHDYFHYILFDDIFKRGQVYNSSFGIIIYILSCIIILLGCSLIYNLFNFIFNKTIYKLDDKYMKNWYIKFNNKFIPKSINNNGKVKK